MITRQMNMIQIIGEYVLNLCYTINFDTEEFYSLMKIERLILFLVPLQWILLNNFEI